jgi:hypothetical protein
MPARLANKRKATAPYFLGGAGRDEAPRLRAERNSGGHLRNFLGFRRRVLPPFRPATPLTELRFARSTGAADVNQPENPRIQAAIATSARQRVD